MATALLSPVFEPAGFVQLRRGLLTHLITGRIDSDELAAFAVLLIKADHRTGCWKGSGRLLSLDLHWCERKARRILASLTKKGYLDAPRRKLAWGSSHWIRIANFFPQPRHADAEVPQTPARRCRLPQEQLLNKTSKPATHTVATSPPPLLEQVRRRHAKERRQHQEQEARRDAAVGSGPTTTVGIRREAKIRYYTTRHLEVPEELLA